MTTLESDGTVTLDVVDQWWRAANYLSVGQIYLLDNPLLMNELRIEHIKPRLLGHWGTTPGINLLWAHCNRLIVEQQERMRFVCGPGHGGPAAVANPWLEGTYSELFPDVDWSIPGMTRLFRQFSFPGGVPSHAGPPTPGSFHEGGELGYALSHAHGAAFDAHGEVVVCLIGDGEAETGPLAASWQSHRFLNPRRDGSVLPVLHLNGWKIANPTILARLPEAELLAYFRGQGYQPLVVEGDDPAAVHEQMAAALDSAMLQLREIRTGPVPTMSAWPLVIMRTPKGWTGPKEVDGLPVEGNFRSHQVPIGHSLGSDRLVELLEQWLRSYRAEELFTADGAPHPDLDTLRPEPRRRMSAHPAANATEAAVPLRLRAVEQYAVEGRAIEDGGTQGSMAVAGRYLRDVVADNPASFRLFGPDEVESNRLSAVFESTDRVWQLPEEPGDEHLARSGQVLEILSEHQCQGWLEGYTLSGRHGVFTTYEAFVHIVDSMFNQHAKWLEGASEVPWRKPMPSFNYLLSSHVWRQDHNGFSHQDPGFLDVVLNKRPEVVRVYLPPDANSLLVTLDHCLRQTGTVNVIVAGKQPEPQYLGLAAAKEHFGRGAGIWPQAGSERADRPPEVVFGCAGDVPTMEAVAAADLLRTEADLSVRLVNVIDLPAMASPRHDPRGLEHEDYDRLFPPGIPTIFAFHGYPWLIHRLTYDRRHHHDLHVHGFIERGTTTTPFDMTVQNRLDRYHLAMAAIDRLPASRRDRLSTLRADLERRLQRHHDHIREVGDDLPEIANWTRPW